MGAHLDRQYVALGYLQGCRSHVDRHFLLHTGERTLGLLGGVACHVLFQPGHGWTLLTILIKAGVAVGSPRGTIDIAPEGNAGAIALLPHIGYLLLVTLQLQVVVGCTDVVLRRVHRHLQGCLDFLFSRLEIVHVAVGQVVRLASVGVNRCSGVTECLNEFYVLVGVPLEGIVVVVNQNGVRPTLKSHLEGLYQPVVARLAASAQRLLHHRIAGLMGAYSLVYYIDERQGGILLLHGVEPLHDSSKAVFRCQVGQPVGILCAPHQGMELVGERLMLDRIFCIVESIVAAPVVAVAGTFYRAPLRLVLTRHLIP